jgi:hypothetical protein
MLPFINRQSHAGGHAFGFLSPRDREGLVVYGRRSVLKSSLAGIGGVSLPALLSARSRGATAAGRDDRAVILVWMTGGPSHIDTWDPKPDMPAEIRGPFQPIATRLPGVQICEYLPKQAAMLDRFTLIRSVDCRQSNHEPNMVMQTANRLAEPRTNSRGHLYPGLGAIVARHRSAVRPDMPPYVALNVQARSHVAGGGAMGTAFDPFDGRTATRVLGLTGGLSADRLADRRRLLSDIDRLRAAADRSAALDAADRFTQQAFDIVIGGRAREAFDLEREPADVRARYGDHEWARQALLARRLVEHGSSFVTIDLSNHRDSGTWDNHGDKISPYGGIWNGLRPLLPVFDHVITTLVTDLEERGLLERTLVVAMGEFGRTPRIGSEDGTDGRSHWPFVMSACLAGGGMRHGQVIGRTSRDAGEIAARPVTPSDLAATIFHHLGVPLDVTYIDHQGRPTYVIEEGGRPLAELV